MEVEVDTRMTPMGRERIPLVAKVRGYRKHLLSVDKLSHPKSCIWAVLKIGQ